MTGVPLHANTDCGSETTLLYGIVNAFRYVCRVGVGNTTFTYVSDYFHPELNAAGLAAHKYLRSIHNIAVERSWKFMRYDFGDNAVLVFQQGIADGIYDEMDPDH